MTFVSYAQNFEDVILWRALKRITHGFYIDVGAAWPDLDSVTKAFYLSGWRGINIEPNKDLYLQLAERRPEDKNICAAVSDVVGTLEIHFMSNAGLSTANAEIAEAHMSKGNTSESREVSAMPLSVIWDQYVPASTDVHFLKIDVEGMEKAVLSGGDWNNQRPWIVLVEATYPLSTVECYEEWESILVEANYLFAYADGLNRFYVSREHYDLLRSFKYPPNFFDDFVPDKQHALEQQLKAIAEKVRLLDEQLRKAQTELGMIVGSRSWRWTKPLRVLAQGARRLSR